MALTLGQNLGSWSNLGIYEAGNFNHTFVKRSVIEPTRSEQAQVLQTFTGAGVPLLVAAKLAGFSEGEIEQMKVAQANEQRQQMAVETFIGNQQNGIFNRAAEKRSAVFSVNGNGRS